jgi:endonuclease G
MEIEYQDRNKLVETLAKQAVNTNTGVISYFDNLIRQANFTDLMKQQRIGGFLGNSEIDARRLVDWALSIGINPKDGNAALGSMVLPLVPRSGLEDAAFLSSMIVAYNLIRSPSVLNALQMQFQIPQPLRDAASHATASVGPDIDWIGPADDVSLQGWFMPEPDFLNVSLLQKAVSRARSVCRVEVRTTGSRGSGVLIGADLVLTNHHVIAMKAASLYANAASAVLRFGAFTAEGSSITNGQEVALNSQTPVLEASPVNELDFVLLRAEESIFTAQDVVPTPLLARSPERHSALHILQHPAGRQMVLALSNNGVTAVDPSSGRVQYVTRTAGGSSGSPCFDADWNLVALHHAEIAKAFGSIREGILMERIFERIKGHLDLSARPSV